MASLHHRNKWALVSTGITSTRAVRCVVPSVHKPHKSHQLHQKTGWFEHGSAIVLLAPSGFILATDVATGETIRCSAERSVDAPQQIYRSVSGPRCPNAARALCKERL